MERTLESLPTRQAMRPKHGRRIEIRNARRNDRSAYTRRES
jgi:hypothetical protein